MSNQLSLYDELLNRKKKGEHLNWTEVNKEFLEKLFCEEELSDSLIARLYDVEKREVTSLRNRYGLKLRDCTNSKHRKEFYEEMKVYNSDNQRDIIILTGNVFAVLQQIKDLSNDDKELLMNGLANEDEYFKGLMNEVKGYRILKKVYSKE